MNFSFLSPKCFALLTFASLLLLIAVGHARAGAITGRVTGPDDVTPLQWVDVSVYRWSGEIGVSPESRVGWEWVDGNETDVNGDFAIDGLPAGYYRILFSDAVWPADYAPEVYEEATDLDSGMDVYVSASETVTGIDASLPEMFPDVGYVSGPDGVASLEETDEKAHQRDVDDTATDSSAGSSADGDGRNDVAGLPAATSPLVVAGYRDVGDPILPSPVHRFWSNRYRGHFFTISEAEKDNIVANLSQDWSYEGVAYNAYVEQKAGTVPLYRFWSNRYRGHFFTISESEKINIIANLSGDWSYEGVAYYVYPDEGLGRSPVHRFWSNRYKHHFFTISESEKINIVANLSRDWSYEGVAFHAVPAGITYTVVYIGNESTDGSTANSSHTYGVVTTLTANGFTRTGYMFAGWATSTGGEVAYSDGQSVMDLAAIQGAVVSLYAKWTPVTYTVAYNGNGSSGGSTVDSSHTYDVSKTLTANGYTRTGYMFAGWATSVDGTVAYSDGQSVQNLAATQGAVATLYAKWIPIPTGMVLIPGGTNSGTDPDFGAYSLTVSPLFMDATEVTKAKWDEVYTWAVAHGYSFDNDGSGKAANHPVHTVNWYDCVKWCNARSQKEGRPAVYTVSGAVYKTGRSDNVVQTSAAGYRLPTDTEWEYAARGGLSGKRFPWGDTITHSQANYYSSSSYSYDTSPTRSNHPTYATGVHPYTSPVGVFAPNGYGLYDMVGNVFEWCFDWHPDFEGSRRVHRGGSWTYGADCCRAASRDSHRPGHASSSIGFRAVLPPGQ